MRATRWRSVAVILAGTLGALGCSSDSNDPDNTAPVANFTSTCTDLTCTFTDLSSDADGTVESLAWDFGDNGTSTVSNPGHTYTAAGTYTVSLTATDDAGDETTVSKTVTVTAVTAGAPVADFDISCNSLDCTFTDASTGVVTSWAWDFGDDATSTAQNPPVHHYNTTNIQTYTAQLTVSDVLGRTSTKSAEFTVSPAATLECEDATNPNEFAACDLVLPAAASVTVTLESASCTANGNTFQITEPIQVTLFTDGCHSPAPGTSFELNNGDAFEAGTRLQAQVISGSVKQEVAPALHVEGSYPTWTLKFDDGEDATPPEPDFNDLVITVTATPAP